MKKRTLLSVFFALIFFSAFIPVTSDLLDDLYSEGKVGSRHLDNRHQGTGSCDCGMYGTGDDVRVYDASAPVFNFPNQKYKFKDNGHQVHGAGKEVISPYSYGVSNMQYVLGEPDGNGVKINGNGNLTIKLQDVVPAGTEYKVHWRRETGQKGFAELHVAEMTSLPGTPVEQGMVLITAGEAYGYNMLVANTDVQYVQFSNQGATAVRVDAITYSIASSRKMTVVMIPNDTVDCEANIPSPLITDDCDALVDVDYIDSVSDGICDLGVIIKRKFIATDDCGNISFAQQTIVLKNNNGGANSDKLKGNGVAVATSFSAGIGEPNKALGVPDAMGAVVEQKGKLTLILTDVIPAGTQYKIHWRQESADTNVAMMKVMESTSASTWMTNGAGVLVNSNSEAYSETVLTAGINTRYVKMYNPGNSIIRVDAVTYTIPKNCVETVQVVQDETHSSSKTIQISNP